MEKKKLTRRDLMGFGLMTATGLLTTDGQAWAQALSCGTQTYIPDIDAAVNLACGVGLEPMPYSPLIVKPFTDAVPLPQAFAPGYRKVDGTLADPLTDTLWAVRQKNGLFGNSVSAPGSDLGAQDSIGDRPNGVGLPRAGTHQLYPGLQTRWDGQSSPVQNYPEPVKYHIRLKVGQHKVTNSPVLPIGIKRNGTIAAIALPGGANNNGANITKTTTVDPVLKSGLPTYELPKSTIYGFNGTFPGPMINVEYGKPALVRFENDLDYNLSCLPRYDYGAPDWAFLTHLHNGHTAPESDGNPHHMTDNGGGYQPGQWCDNLYLNYPAGGDDKEKQSFLWFHDHRMHHTGANVYKGMVGLMPHYDPILDNGNETNPGGVGLPGVRTDNPDGTFDVAYDVPLALYDCTMDDAVTPHFDNHQATADCGKTHPEWWGQRFFRHYPASGFVGDVFTVNGTAFPVMHVKPRRYRMRFLGASIARCYELSFRTPPATTAATDPGMGQPGMAVFPGMQGQWNFATKARNGVITKSAGTLLKKAGNPFMLHVASEGGLLQNALYRDSIQIWPAKRREVVVDFSGMAGQTIYLVNSMQQLDGKKATFLGDKGFDPNYAVPLMKIVVDVPMASGEVDNSATIPQLAAKVLRQMPSRSGNIGAAPVFNLKNGNPLNPQGVGSGETKWLVNDMEFNPSIPLHTVTEGVPENWTINNLSGGWTHPFHMHMEEHQVLSRDSILNPHPEDGPPAIGKEDVVALDPGESVTFYRNFRTFCGKYVAHCHNLAHEDHNMMFGWTIKPKPRS